jgi:hypothetical protein
MDFTMSSDPDLSWSALPDDLPGIPAGQPIVPVPIIASAGRSFKDSMEISVSSSFPGAQIHFTTASQQVRRYSRPFVIRDNTTVAAYATKAGFIPSRTVTALFTKASRIGTLKLFSQYAPQYAAGGSEALVDGLRGGEDFRLGTWQGYEGFDLVAVLDLGQQQILEGVSLGCLQDNNAWIFFPRSVEFSFSDDGISFSRSVTVPNSIPAETPGTLIREFETGAISVSSRYVRIHARNLGICPPWHKGAGGKAWLFADEITIRAKGPK